jgi:hypothetical protein
MSSWLSPFICDMAPRCSGAEDLTGFFALPISSLLQWPVELYSAGTWAIIDARAAIPAFLRVQDDRALPGVGIGDEHIHGAVFHTRIAPVAHLGIEDCRAAGRRNVWNRIHCHSRLLIRLKIEILIRKVLHRNWEHNGQIGLSIANGQSGPFE